MRNFKWLMVVGLAVVGLGIGLAIQATGIGFGSAQAKESSSVSAQLAAPFQYVVKFVCVGEVGRGLDAFQKGKYRTVVNVHNPWVTTQSFGKKAVIARSEDEPRGRVSEIVPEQLEADEAFSVDCEDINGLFGGVAQPIGDGFVVLLSNVQLDVVAVYTAKHRGTTSDSDVETIDVEYIQPTILHLPDLAN